jgi:hypothetical protein
MSDKVNNEQRYYDALKRITQYQTVERMQRDSEKDWGLEFTEALSYAYENVKDDAARAIKGRRRPK